MSASPLSDRLHDRSKAAGTAGHRWLDLTDAADYIGVTTRTVRNLIARGELSARRIGRTRMIRIDRDDLDALLRPIPTTDGVRHA